MAEINKKDGKSFCWSFILHANCDQEAARTWVDQAITDLRARGIEIEDALFSASMNHLVA